MFKSDSALVQIINKLRGYEDRFFLSIISVIFFAWTFLFLHQGYNASDEGYLLAHGYRITLGQVPYQDFHYSRTPLQLFIHYLFIKIFPDYYTIYLIRIFWSIQVWGSLIVSYLILRYISSPVKTALFISPAILFPSLIIRFPWYTLDGVFFLLISFYFILKANFSKKEYLFLSGISICLAFLSKQTFILIIPGLFLFCSVNSLWNKRFNRNLEPRLPFLVPIIMGFLFGLAPFLLYLYSKGIFYDFYYDCFIIYGSNEDLNLGLQWFVFQNIPDRIMNYRVSLVSFFIFILLMFSFKSYQGKFKFGTVILASILPLTYILNYYDSGFVNAMNYFVNNLLILNFLILITALVGAYSTLIRKRSETLTRILPFLFFAISIQYLAGFNLSGIFFSNVGTFLSLPLTLLIAHDKIFRIRNSNFHISFDFVNFNLERKINATSNATCFLVSLMIMLAIVYSNFVFQDYPRNEIDHQFQTSELKGIYSNEVNVKGIDSLVIYIENGTAEGDHIFIFPDYPILYYITDTENPTMLDWYYNYDFNLEIAEKAIDDLENNRPKFIILQKFWVSDIYHEKTIDYSNLSEKYQVIYYYIVSNFELVEEVNGFYIYS